MSEPQTDSELWLCVVLMSAVLIWFAVLGEMQDRQIRDLEQRVHDLEIAK